MSNSGGSTLKLFSDVFSGNVAVQYAAFNLRDNYYREMATILIEQVAAKRARPALQRVLEIGPGIGISSLVFAEKFAGNLSEFYLLEPNPQMRALCALNFLGDPRVHMLSGDATAIDTNYGFKDFDAVLASQMFHFLYPSREKSQVGVVAKKAYDILDSRGLLAFDLGPSNFQFSTPISDHRTGIVKDGEQMTELSHPLYQRAHQIMCTLVSSELGRPVESLWPTASAQMTRAYLEETLREAGFSHVYFHEELGPEMRSSRIINFIRNGWSVFFRWVTHNEISQERQFQLVEKMLEILFQEDLDSIFTARHPTVVVVARK